MLAKVRGHFRSNVVAYLALFFALSAPAAALFMVTGADIKDGTVTGADVKDESLTGVDVLNNSLKGADVDETSLAGVNADKLDGVDSTGFLGASAKAADADELDGKDSSEFLGASATAADANLLGGRASVPPPVTARENGPDNSFETVTATCPNDGVALRGRAEVFEPGVSVSNESYGRSSFSAQFSNNSGGPQQYAVHVTCITAPVP